MPVEWVTIKHPHVKQTSRASRDSFEQVWKGLGWTLDTEEETEKAAPRIMLQQEENDTEEAGSYTLQHSDRR